MVEDYDELEEVKGDGTTMINTTGMPANGFNPRLGINLGQDNMN